MAICLEKGQRIDLEKNDGSRLTHFCVGCNWGAIERYVEVRRMFGLMSSRERQVVDVDLDLSCVLVDGDGRLCDYIYSPLYNTKWLDKFGLRPGKLDSTDGALHHSGDDLKGDRGGDDGLDNEIVTVDLARVSSGVAQIFFLLNNCGKEDFSQIPYASIRMYEGTPTSVRSVFASYNVAAEGRFAGKTASIMGKLYRNRGDWKFSAIGDVFDDAFVGQTITRVISNYAR